MTKFAHKLTLGTLFITGALAATACDSDDPGTVETRVWGEGYLENGVPAPDVLDGWKIDFELYETEVADLEIAGQSVPLLRSKINATHKSSSDELGVRGQAFGSLEFAPGTYSNAAFTIVKTVIAGRAQQGDKQVTFNWTFDTPVRYSKCEARMRVKSGHTSVFEITMHADHYLFDTLTSLHEPRLFFGPIAAADTNGDGVITKEELALAPIADSFDTGSQKITNMWDWLSAQNLTIAHTNGEHHCKGAVLAVAPG